MIKYIKSSALVAGLFLLSGCGSGACCTTDVEVAKNSTPSGVNETVDPFGERTETLVPKGIDETTETFKPDGVADGVDYLTGVDPDDVVTFEDIGSYEEDANLTYRWLERCGSELSTESEFDYTFTKKGAYETTLVVSDDKNNTAIDRVCVLVGIDETEIPLMADAGIDRTIESNQTVTLTGRLVCQQKENVTYTWSEDGSELTFPLTLPVGEHTLILTANDGQTEVKDSVVITVK